MSPLFYLLSCLSGNKTSDDSVDSSGTGRIDSRDSQDSTGDSTDTNPPDPVVKIVYDTDPVTISIPTNDIGNGLPMAVGDINGDGVDDLCFVTPDFGTAAGKAYCFTKLSTLLSGNTALAEDADIQIEGGNRNGLYTLAIGDPIGAANDSLYLGFSGLSGVDAFVAFNNPEAVQASLPPNQSIDMSDVFDPNTVPSGWDMTVVSGPVPDGYLGGNLIYVGDVDGQGERSLIASGGSFCGIFNLSSLVSAGTFIDYTQAIIHEVTQNYGGGSLCESERTQSGDLNSDGINDLIFGSLSTLASSYHGWIVPGGALPYTIDLPMLGSNSSSFVPGTVTWQDGVEGVSNPSWGDFDLDGAIDLFVAGWRDKGVADFISGQEYQAKVNDGTLSTGANINLDYTTGPMNLSSLSGRTFTGDTSNTNLNYKNVAVWSNSSLYPDISLMAMGASISDGATVFVVDKARYDSTANTTITLNGTDDQKLPDTASVSQVLFSDFNGDDVPDLAVSDQVTGEIKIFFGREVHQSELPN